MKVLKQVGTACKLADLQGSTHTDTLQIWKGCFSFGRVTSVAASLPNNVNTLYIDGPL